MKEPFYKAKSSTEVNLYIYGAIGTNNTYFEDGTNNTAFGIINLLKKLENEYKRINVHISSPGGYINAGLTIFNALKASKAEIHTYNDGFVGSMASIIVLAGISHFPTTSVYHLHSAWTLTGGGVREHEDSINSLQTFETVLQQAISEKTGISIEEIKNKWFNGREHFLTATEAHELGFVDYLDDEQTNGSHNKSINELQSMDYIDIFKSFSQTQKNKNVFQKVKAKFFAPENNNQTNIKMEKIKLHANLSILLAALESEGLNMNDSGNIELSVNDVYNIEAKLQEFSNKIEELTGENNARKQTIEEMQSNLENEDADEPESGKYSDNAVKDAASDEMNEETRKRLRAYNIEQGLY